MAYSLEILKCYEDLVHITSSCASCEDSGEPAQMRSLVRAFADADSGKNVFF